MITANALVQQFRVERKAVIDPRGAKVTVKKRILVLQFYDLQFCLNLQQGDTKGLPFRTKNKF